MKKVFRQYGHKDKEYILEKEFKRAGKKFFYLVPNKPSKMKTRWRFDEYTMSTLFEVENACIHEWEEVEKENHKTTYECSKCKEKTTIDDFFDPSIAYNENKKKKCLHIWEEIGAQKLQGCFGERRFYRCRVCYTMVARDVEIYK